MVLFEQLAIDSRFVVEPLQKCSARQFDQVLESGAVLGKER